MWNHTEKTKAPLIDFIACLTELYASLAMQMSLRLQLPKCNHTHTLPLTPTHTVHAAVGREDERIKVITAAPAGAQIS